MKILIHSLIFSLMLISSASGKEATRQIVDALGRNVEIPSNNERVICSGSGCLRLLTYLQAESMAVAVDDIEPRKRRYEARPYALANPHFKTMPVFGGYRGHDNPELILALEPQPQVIFKTYASSMGFPPEDLQNKTGIPVVTLDYGNLGKKRPQLYQSLRTMADVIGKQKRAEEVIAFIESQIFDLNKRTADIPEQERPSVFIGGVAFKGPHGYQSTEPAYPPFAFVSANNFAFNAGGVGKELQHSAISKEKILEWDPEILFLDLSTLQMGDKAGGLYELQTDPSYRALNAVKKGKVYALLPYNWYSRNYGSILANAFYVGKLLYPERFVDVDSAVKADEIYKFLVGKDVFEDMNTIFHGMAYKPVPVN